MQRRKDRAAEPLRPEIIERMKLQTHAMGKHSVLGGQIHIAPVDAAELSAEAPYVALQGFVLGVQLLVPRCDYLNARHVFPAGGTHASASKIGAFVWTDV
jgi:hypothetical protein